MSAITLPISSARTSFITIILSWPQVIKLRWTLYFHQSSPVSVQMICRSFSALRSFHLVIPTLQLYPVNHSVTKLTRTVGKNLERPTFRFRIVTSFFQMRMATTAFAKSLNGLHHGQKNFAQHHPVSIDKILLLRSVIQLIGR